LLPYITVYILNVCSELCRPIPRGLFQQNTISYVKHSGALQLLRKDYLYTTIYHCIIYKQLSLVQPSEL